MAIIDGEISREDVREFERSISRLVLRYGQRDARAALNSVLRQAARPLLETARNTAPGSGISSSPGQLKRLITSRPARPRAGAPPAFKVGYLRLNPRSGRGGDNPLAGLMRYPEAMWSEHGNRRFPGGGGKALTRSATTAFQRVQTRFVAGWQADLDRFFARRAARQQRGR